MDGPDCRYLLILRLTDTVIHRFKCGAGAYVFYLIIFSLIAVASSPVSNIGRLLVLGHPLYFLRIALSSKTTTKLDVLSGKS